MGKRWRLFFGIVTDLLEKEKAIIRNISTGQVEDKYLTATIEE